MVEHPTPQNINVVPDEDSASLKVALLDAFGVPFQVWKPITDDTTSSEPYALETSDGRSACQSISNEIACRAFTPVSTPEVLPVESNRWMVVLPLRIGADVTQVATAEFQTTAPDMLQRLAVQFDHQRTLCNRLSDVQADADALVRQISTDLEELSFLRSLAEHMAVSEDSSDTLEIAKSILPLLQTRIEAEEVAMIVSDQGDSQGAAERPILHVGDSALGNRLRMQLLQRFRNAASRQTVVKNHCDRDDDFSEFPGLRSFILSPMTRGNHEFGWLLAINRLRTSSDSSGSTSWHLSQHEFGTNEESLLKSTASILATHASNVRLFRDKEQLLIDMVRALVHAIEAKDRYTFGHSERVALYAKELGAKIGLEPSDCNRIYLTGLLHDVGKIAIRDNVLGKPGRLDNDEFQEIKRHPDEGWAILQGLTALENVLCGVLHHHERWDGKGYPDGLAGEIIPLECRILAVADAFDAMTSTRPYRAAMPLEKALQLLCDGQNTQWDPRVIDAFMRALPEMQAIQQNYELREPVVRQASERSGIATTVPWQVNTMPVGLS